MHNVWEWGRGWWRPGRGPGLVGGTHSQHNPIHSKDGITSKFDFHCHQKLQHPLHDDGCRSQSDALRQLDENSLLKWTWPPRCYCTGTDYLLMAHRVPTESQQGHRSGEKVIFIGIRKLSVSWHQREPLSGSMLDRVRPNTCPTRLGPCWPRGSGGSPPHPVRYAESIRSSQGSQAGPSRGL